MKRFLLLLTSFVIVASVNVAVAESATDQTPGVLHSAFVDTPNIIDLSRADPTSWPVPSASPASPSGKGWRYFEENRVAGE